MTVYSHNMGEEITYWPATGSDAFGGATFGAPTAVRARWQDTAELFRDAEGREVTSSAIVYVDTEVAVRGFLYCGVSTDAEPPEGAREIRQVAQSPGLKQQRRLIKAML